MFVTIVILRQYSVNKVVYRYIMAEVVQNIMVPGPKQFSIHILNRDDHPFTFTQKWSSQDKGMFYLIPKAVQDNLSEIVHNVSLFVYKLIRNVIYDNNYILSNRQYDLQFRFVWKSFHRRFD